MTLNEFAPILFIIAAVYAFFFAAPKWGWTKVVWTTMFLLGVTPLIAVFLNPPAAQRRQQTQEAQENSRRAKEADAAQAKQDKELCRLKSACEHFASARKKCAVAGDFNNCVRIEMGGHFVDSTGLLFVNMDFTSLCRNDGGLRYHENQLPSSVKCFFTNLSRN